MSKFIIWILSGLLGLLFSLYHYGKFNLVNSSSTTMPTFHYPALFVKQLAGDPQAGRKIFKEFCASCHANQPLIEVGAPRIGDQKTWRRLRQAGMAALLKNTITGVGAMPARGGCFECSDEQLQAAISYINQGTLLPIPEHFLRGKRIFNPSCSQANSK